MLVVTEAKIYVDGATLKGVKNEEGNPHFTWSGTVTDERKQLAEERMRVILKNFDKED